jgi:hypothetical protein
VVTVRPRADRRSSIADAGRSERGVDRLRRGAGATVSVIRTEKGSPSSPTLGKRASTRRPHVGRGRNKRTRAGLAGGPAESRRPALHGRRHQQRHHHRLGDHQRADVQSIPTTIDVLPMVSPDGGKRARHTRGDPRRRTLVATWARLTSGVPIHPIDVTPGRHRTSPLDSTERESSSLSAGPMLQARPAGQKWMGAG